LNNIDIVYI